MTWTEAFDSIKHMDDKIHKIEEVSGQDIDTLISLFEAGYTLNAPTINNVCPECNGSGFVQIAPGVRGIKACPRCNPVGNKR